MQPLYGRDREVDPPQSEGNPVPATPDVRTKGGQDPAGSGPEVLGVCADAVQQSM